MKTKIRPGSPPPKRSRIGDLRMGVIYRWLAAAAAVVVVAVVAVVLVLPSGSDEDGRRPIAAPSAAPASSAPPASLDPAPTPVAVDSTPIARPTPEPGASLAPGYTAMEALHADARLPRLPGKVRRLKLPAPAKRVIRDKRTGLALPDLGRPWKTYGAAPFTSKQVLPKQRGDSRRGMLVSCPVPIEPQKSARDTALLAARWTLNHHPEGAKIRWLASQPVKRGWMLVYQVSYGKRSSRAAVVVADGGMAKPGLAFVTVPDTQRKRWRDITRVVSGVRVLG
ncbi:hypothetical protein [Nonomuraea sp. SBT364]|uniref:hypothetical protein n=1 Tax=Nonomuraea sp. SBT364 TaxID=1580530 RepID=UPI00066A9331|nr:hypothetical protein [Nonomuraea sp. SBT364]